MSGRDPAGGHEAFVLGSFFASATGFAHRTPKMGTQVRCVSGVSDCTLSHCVLSPSLWLTAIQGIVSVSLSKPLSTSSPRGKPYSVYYDISLLTRQSRQIRRLFNMHSEAGSSSAHCILDQSSTRRGVREMDTVMTMSSDAARPL